ncbi:MAG: transcription termination/antitermination protein NusA [Candidatus Omnitrophica bacterium]|nr:transcription termination/antitermination protein NusA [Candidatus Omnitrophota bacterium]MCB9721306.1 transcription termination/antitermination protein NusA [Candidatus Omnitrophota bacterium]
MESSELLAILEQLERDKGINKDVLVEAVEAAVASAAKKLWTVDKDEEVRVELDKVTGKLTAYAGDEEIRSSEFGRIAAQTAKQVVIQKIREAEKDVVFDEYRKRVGEIISGSVYRFERGNIIIDLGKTEALIPRREQSSKEEFKQGDRIRAYVLDVKRENRGPQIILSRAHPQFVKRLFELEVPEILEGIVEIKSISRDVSERTKIAVHSKDEKVDSVGACVGMRGSRVKNIVSELQGEKIDIVRYSQDIKEYIQAALSPAEISQIQLDYDGKKANIIVADDQLSLAIGKHGQNVRLASQLVGWELDLFSFDQWAEYQEKLEQEEEAEQDETAAGTEEGASPASGAGDSGEDGDQEEYEEEIIQEISIADLTGVGDKLIAELEAKDLGTLDSIAEASVEDLTQIKGLGKIKAQKMIEEAKKLLAECEEE